MKWLKRFLTPPLIVIAAVLMWIEESLWIWLKRLTTTIAQIPLIHQIESAVLQLPPSLTVVVFFLPMLTLFPLKILAVYLATRGLWLASIGVLIAAKVLGTAIVARLYVVCQPKLMSIKWFCRVHDWLVSTRDQLYAAVRSLPFYQAIRTYLAAIKNAAKYFRQSVFGRRGIWARWRAIRRWHRNNRKN